jgi:hypothetical protein
MQVMQAHHDWLVIHPFLQINILISLGLVVHSKSNEIEARMHVKNRHSSGGGATIVTPKQH